MEQSRLSSSSILRGTSIVSCLTLLSRILGFIRDLLTARLFGASPIADAYFVAFRIPNLLRSFVAEGALTSAFVPVFAENLATGHKEAQNTIRAVTGLLLAVTAILTLLGITFAPEIVTLFAPGFVEEPSKQSLCIFLTQIMFPYIMCVSLVAMLNGILNSIHIYGTSAMAQVWMNLVLIAGAIIGGLYQGPLTAEILSWSVLIGGIVQVATQIPALVRNGFSPLPARPLLTPATKQIFFLMLPAIVGATVYQLQIFLNTVLASLLRDGSVSWLFYADRLVQLPIGIFSIALASVLLPALSHSAANGNQQEFSKSLVNSLRYTSFIIIPTATIIALFASPLISLMFEYGRFTHEATIQTAKAVVAYSIGLWAVSCHSMVVRAFIASKDTLTPTCVGMFTLIITSFLSLSFMGHPEAITSGTLYNLVVGIQEVLPLSSFGIDLGHAGLALASSIASFFSFGVLAIVLHRRKSIAWAPFIKATISISLACLVTAIIVKFSIVSIDRPSALIFGLPLSVISLMAILAITKNTEFRETFSLISRLIVRR